MNVHENFNRIAYYLAENDKNLDVFGQICMIQNFHKIFDLIKKESLGGAMHPSSSLKSNAGKILKQF